MEVSSPRQIKFLVWLHFWNWEIFSPCAFFRAIGVCDLWEIVMDLVVVI